MRLQEPRVGARRTRSDSYGLAAPSERVANKSGSPRASAGEASIAALQRGASALADTALTPSTRQAQESTMADVKARLEQMLKDDHASGGGGVTNEQLKDAFGDEFDDLPAIINDLINSDKVELLQGEGRTTLAYQWIPEDRAARLGELTNEQRLVLQVVERADTSGVWLRDIKSATSMQQQTLNKALKVLESRKLVKTVRSVQQKTKKLYAM